MRTATLLFVLFSTFLLGEAERAFTKLLFLDNGLSHGKWGDREFCDEGTFVSDIEIKFQDHSLLEVDETACNAIKLYCSTPDGHLAKYVTSTVGGQGSWKGMRGCTKGILMTGMRAKVMPPKGLIGDDEAVENLQMECDHGEDTVLAYEGDETTGEWSSWDTCGKGEAICGIKVRFEASSLIEDDMAIADLELACCALDAIAP